MKYRLTKIYTKTGDHGKTCLGDGTTLLKNDPRVEVMGEVDELNSALGVIVAQEKIPEKIHEILTRVQNELFDLGAELCLPDKIIIAAENVTQLENDIDHFNENLPKLTEFVLPGGTLAAAHCHMARCICRRLERRYVHLSQTHELPRESQRYLNRLSDLLFVLARALNQSANKNEALWRGTSILK